MRCVAAARSARRVVVVGVLTAFAGLALPAGSAWAGKVVVSVLGSAGTGAGQFTVAGATAVNVVTGDVYVVDQGANRVEQFDSTGAFVRLWGFGVSDGAGSFEECTSVCQAGIAGAGAGQFDGLQGIAVDQSDGSVYVVDSNNGRVQKFTSAGVFVSEFATAGSGDGELSGAQGVAVDPLDGSVYVADTGNQRVEKFTAAGAYVSQFGSEGAGDGQFEGPTRVAVDSTGRVYVVDSGNARVERFSAAGVFDEVIDPVDVFYPSEIAIGPGNDHVYVGQYAQDFSEQRALELDSAGTLVDTHGVGSGASSLSGLAVSAAAQQLYLADGANTRVFVLDDLTAPTATIDPASGVTSTSASLSGVVNPHGPPDVSWHFETSTDDASWTPVAAGQLAGSGTSDVTVNSALSGLVPNTTYFIRLVATRPFNLPALSSEVQFTTDAIGPTGSTQPANDLTPTHATLDGLLDAHHAPTTYYFQWGTTTSYGTNLPAAQNADAGAADGTTQVLQQLGGLQPGATYHYRLVAHNQAGTLTGADQVFATPTPLPASAQRADAPGSGLLPDNRAWEQVSPPDKHGSDVIATTVRTRAAATETAALPMAATFTSLGGFADEHGSGVASEYMAIRTAQPGTSGWATHGITPPQNSLSFINDTQFFDPLWEGELSSDLTHGVFRAVSPLGDTPAVAHVENLYVRDDLRTPGHGAYQLVSDCTACGATPLPTSFATQQVLRLAGASDDFGHVLFESVQPLVPGATATDDINSGTFIPNVYEWDNGTLRLAGVLPDTACGSPPCVAPRSVAGHGAGVGTGGANHNYTRNVISADGSRIFFTDGNGDLYMRSSHASTVKLNRSERTLPDAPQPATFELASKDGSRVFFTTQEQLTNDDGDTAVDLYMYDTGASTGHHLSRLSVDHEPADPPNDVTGVVGVSDDGHYVYFIAAGQLAAGKPLRTPQSIYEWHDGNISFIGQISVYDGGTDLPSTWDATPLSARVTPDGRHLMFVSHSGAGLTSYDNGNTCVASTFDRGDEPCGELYVYSADSHQLACASCNPSGAGATANARVNSFEGIGASIQTWHLNHPLSDDGRRVFFSSGEALVSQDTNGKVDAYEYDVPSGTVHLLSSGTEPSNSYFLDASANGDDVFFATRQRLVGWDTDQNYDLYDARVNGGVPEPVAVAPGCSGEGCHGPLTLAPAAAVPGSASIAPGVAKVASRPKAKKRKAVKCKRGFVRKRVRGKVHCVKRHPAKAKKAKGKKAAAKRGKPAGTEADSSARRLAGGSGGGR
jgi:DNA-binding beta-propeller fold protein YncE